MNVQADMSPRERTKFARSLREFAKLSNDLADCIENADDIRATAMLLLFNAAGSGLGEELGQIFADAYKVAEAVEKLDDELS